jgi:putative holliday junction resolvase
MHILAVDFGTKNIGLAWVETGVGVVLPYGIIKNDTGKGGQELAKLIADEKIDKVVFGLPLGLDGSENTNTKKIREFAGHVGQVVKSAIVFETEMFSSRQADRTAGGASRDEKAAMIILEDYLKKNKL